jgi:hypothetical protein
VQNSPNPTLPYTNWETAAHTIQDAVVSVCQATLSSSRMARISATCWWTNLRLVSANGPQLTVIDGGARTAAFPNHRRGGVWVHAHQRCKLPSPRWRRWTRFMGPQHSQPISTNCVLAGNAWTRDSCTLQPHADRQPRGTNTGTAAINCTLYNCNITGNSG